MSYAALSLDSRKSSPRRMAGPLLLVLVLFYLGFHAVSGERGALALIKARTRLESVEAELAAARAERMALELKVKRLSDNSLDLDLLDEQARTLLGYADKNEMVVFLPREK